MLRKSIQANTVPFGTCRDRWHRQSLHSPSPVGFGRRLHFGSRRTVPALTSVAPTPAPTGREQDNSSVDWSKQWWPVQLVRNLEVDRPNRVQLLGRWFVVWKAKSGDWVVMDDECPHRLAPLSEGRIESDGNLLCAYHAWRFNEDGKCVEIPQADDAKSKSVACSHPRSCVTKYPCRAYGSMLWVWPDDAPTAFIDASATVIPMPPYLAEPLGQRAEQGFATGYTRKLPYSYDVLVENLMDPAHVLVSHHGLFGNSRYDACGLNMKENEPLDNPYKDKTILAFEYDSITRGGEWAHVQLTLPGFIEYRGSPKKGSDKWIGQYLYAVPLEEGKSRAFTFAGSDAMVKSPPSGSVPLPLKLMPWLLCFTLGKLFDGDSVFLRLQDQHLKSTDANNRRPGWRKYFMPTSADRSIAAFRRWLETEGGGGPKLPAGGIGSNDSGDGDREVVLDRYSQHSKDCKDCQKGLAFMNRVVTISQLGIVACILAWLRGEAAVASHWQWLLGVGICLGALLRNWAMNEKKKFYFVDYIHAEHD